MFGIGGGFGIEIGGRQSVVIDGGIPVGMLGGLEVEYAVVRTTEEALRILSNIRKSFHRAYKEMLWQALTLQFPIAVCTIYDSVPGLSDELKTALTVFNDAIVREALAAKLQIIDLRNICTDEADYSPVSPIEPSEEGGRKIAQAILSWAESSA